MSLSTIQEFRRRYPLRPNDEDYILGSGSYGKVVKVEDQVETEWVAVKIGEFKGDDSKSLRAEVDLARKIPRHPNIARYDECYRFETDTNVCDFAIMRYYPDGNLAMLMRHTLLTLTQKEEIVRGILLGLQHLHRQRIVHRDFKPANILISRDNQGRFIPKIADFGLSKLVQEEEIDSSDFDLSDGRGTPSYKAPEQITGGKVSFNLDLWAFGVILFELFTGEKPFMASHKTGSEHVMKREIEKKIVNVTLPDRVQQVPEPYQSILRRCLVKDVRKRARKEEELLDLLDGLPALLNEAEQLLRNQNIEEAIARYETVLTRRDNHPKATEGLKAAQELARKRERSGVNLLPEADAMFFRQAYAEARQVYETVLKAEPQNAQAKRQIAACDAALHRQRVDKLWVEAEHFHTLGKFEVAKARYAEVIQLDATHFLAHTRLGEIEKAEYQQKIAALLAEADARFTRKHYAEAKLAYETVLGLENQNATARRQIAAIDRAFRQRQVEEQLRGAQRLVTQKQFAPAKLAFEKILRDDEHHEAARQGLVNCVAALAPKTIPVTELTDVYSPDAPEESTDLFKPDERVPIQAKQATHQPGVWPGAPAAAGEPSGIAKPVRPRFVIRPVYLWATGVVLLLSAGGYFWVSRSTDSGRTELVPMPKAPPVEDVNRPVLPGNTAVVRQETASSAPSDATAARLKQYTRLVQQATLALNDRDLATAKHSLDQARALNPAGTEVKRLGASLQLLDRQLASQSAKEVEQAAQEAAQTRYDALIFKGVEVIETGNRKAEAIGYFQQAHQLAQANGLSTAKAAERYGTYVAKGDRIFQNDDQDGAKAWYQVAQALQNTDEVRRKIRECNMN